MPVNNDIKFSEREERKLKKLFSTATSVPLTDGDKGDITVSGSGGTFTIDSDVVSNTKLANMATARFKGRVTAGTGDPEDLTGTQATTLLDVFTSSLKGLAPASGGSTNDYLRADGTWTKPGYTATFGPFLVFNMVGTDTAQGTLDVAGTFNRDLRMPLAGRVVGAWIVTNQNRTAGTATLRIRISGVGGTVFASDAVQLNGTNVNRSSAVVTYTSGVSFSANTDVGVEVTTSGWTPTTADVQMFFMVRFDSV